MFKLSTTALVALVSCFGILSAAPVPTNSSSDQRELEKSYSYLVYHDTNSALFGLLPLARRTSKDVVPFLEKKMKPVKLAEDRAKQLLADLGSDDVKVAEAAHIELAYLDIRLAMNLQKAFAIIPQGVARQRLLSVIEGVRLNDYEWCKIDYGTGAVMNKDGTVRFEETMSIENMPGKPADFKSYCDQWQGGRRMSHRVPSAVSELDLLLWKRQSRCIAILEWLGTPDATKLIATMEDGHPDATPTVAAKAALRRLAGPPAKPDFKKIWDDLLKNDDVATAGVLAMLKYRAEAYAAIKANLRPIKLTEDRCRDLVLALGDADEKKWRAAWDELGYLDPRLAFDLPNLMGMVPEGLARTRLAERLCNVEPDSMKGLTLELGKQENGISFFQSEKSSRSVESDCKRLRIPAWERARAVVQILDEFETPEAAKLIEEIAAGHPKAVPTVMAKFVLERKKGETIPKRP